MHTLRLSLAGTIILVLLGGASIAVAQESEDAEAVSAPVVVSGTLECLGEAPSGDVSEDGATATDAVVNLHQWEASDPRLQGEASYAGRWQVYGEPQEDRGESDAKDAVLYAIVNEGGKWLCEASRLPDPMVPSEQHTLVFSGEGDYEGMTAYLHIDWSEAPYDFTGLILPGDEPPYAEPQG
jgi:hypothetical protein